MENFTIKSFFDFYKPKESELLISDKLVSALCNNDINYIHPVIEVLSIPDSFAVNEMMIEYINKKTALGLSNPHIDLKSLIGNNKIIFCRFSGHFIGCNFESQVIAFAFGDNIENIYPHLLERTMVHEYMHKVTFNPKNALLTFIAEGIAASAEVEYILNQYNEKTIKFQSQYLEAYKFIDGVKANYVDSVSYSKNIIRGNESHFINDIKEIIQVKAPDMDVDAYLSLNGLLFYICEYEHPDYCDSLYKWLSNFNAKIFDKSSIITEEEKLKIKKPLEFTKILNRFVELMPDKIASIFTRSIASYLCKSAIGNEFATILLLSGDEKSIFEFLTTVKERVEDYCNSRNELHEVTDDSAILEDELKFWKQKLGLQEDKVNKEQTIH